MPNIFSKQKLKEIKQSANKEKIKINSIFRTNLITNLKTTK